MQVLGVPLCLTRQQLVSIVKGGKQGVYQACRIIPVLMTQSGVYTAGHRSHCISAEHRDGVSSSA